MYAKCPGINRLREPIPELFICPRCGSEVEIWTHERMKRCSLCRSPVIRDVDNASCTQWCRYAKECIGVERYEELLKSGIISKEKKQEVNIPERLKEFMKECGIPIPGEERIAKNTQ